MKDKILKFLTEQHKNGNFNVKNIQIEDIEFLTDKLEGEGLLNHTIQEVGMANGEYYNEVRYYSNKIKKTIVFYEDMYVEYSYDNVKSGLNSMAEAFANLNQEIEEFEANLK